MADGLNRSRGNCSGQVVPARGAVGSAKLASEAIRLAHQRSCNHGHDHPRGLAAASTHDRRHAHAQAGGQDSRGLHPRRPQVDHIYLKRSPDTATVEDLRNFQLHLVDTGTSPITLNATLTGLKVFFDITLGRGELMARMQPVKLPRTVPVVLSMQEAAALIAAARNIKHQAALSVAYGAGLRASEVCRLKVGDVDSERMALRVEQGKGAKDRYAMLSPVVLQRLRAWWRIGHARARSCPAAGSSLGWIRWTR